MNNEGFGHYQRSFCCLSAILFKARTLLLLVTTLTYSSEKILGGFIRGGLYTWVDKTDNKLYFPSAFSDAGTEAGNR